MAHRDNRRVLVFVLLAALLFTVAALLYHRVGRRPTPEERARETAGELRDKVRDLTHGK